jgi:hypothetical protein
MLPKRLIYPCEGRASIYPRYIADRWTRRPPTGEYWQPGTGLAVAMEQNGELRILFRCSPNPEYEKTL